MQYAIVNDTAIKVDAWEWKEPGKLTTVYSEGKAYTNFNMVGEKVAKKVNAQWFNKLKAWAMDKVDIIVSVGPGVVSVRIGDKLMECKSLIDVKQFILDCHGLGEYFHNGKAFNVKVTDGVIIVN